ncbi:MAG: response regulator [Chloroflexi bacterium]|nr:response regulator [Chloroflexota bacterium]
MSYKVFFVEDEIITREGIRDNVDWQANGFEYCGEAADGEMALPLLRAIQPDVLITDIKMPFMDGLQLSKIVRERMPWVKIIILSGHDEFEYAQEAIGLGVTDYLLKPVTVHKLHNVLQKLTLQLDQERKEQARLIKLQEQMEENQATLRERLLFKLVVGAVSPTEAIEKGQILGLDFIARYYLVVILKFELGDRTEQYDYDEFQRVQKIVIQLAERNPDIFVLKRDWGDLILMIKGSTSEYLEEERDLLLEEIRQAVAKTRYQVTIGVGTSKKRVADIYQSFVEALVNMQSPAGESKSGLNQAVERAELLKVDKSAVENYLRCGVKDGFSEFFNAYIRPLGETALKSNLIKNYIFVDVVLATAKLVNDLGGDVDNVIPELNSIEMTMSNIKTIDQLQEQAYKILSSALAYRDSQPNGQYRNLIRQAREYIEHHYTNPELSLNEVAAQANLSASHFSVVFSQETHQTFKEYLTEIRIKKAKELLRMTALRSADIAYQVGYNDPHYFSSVFKKNTGLSPMEFRSQM